MTMATTMMWHWCGGTELFRGATTLHRVRRNQGIRDGRIGSPAGAVEILHWPNISGKTIFEMHSSAALEGLYHSQDQVRIITGAPSSLIPTSPCHPSSIALAIASIDGFSAIVFVSPLPTPLSPPHLAVIHGCKRRLG